MQFHTNQTNMRSGFLVAWSMYKWGGAEGGVTLAARVRPPLGAESDPLPRRGTLLSFHMQQGSSKEKQTERTGDTKGQEAAWTLVSHPRCGNANQLVYSLEKQKRVHVCILGGN